MDFVFKDRFDAGSRLASLLKEYKNKNAVLIAIPRGGVPVGYEIAKKLNASLDIIAARKIGHPKNPEFGIGAISENEIIILDQLVPENIIKKEEKELKRRIKIFRQNKSLSYIKGRQVILVDDGVAQGVTAIAAIKALKKFKPKSIIFAAPICARQSLHKIEREVEKVFCLIALPSFKSIGEFYENFDPTTDEEVINLLDHLP